MEYCCVHFFIWKLYFCSFKFKYNWLYFHEIMNSVWRFIIYFIIYIFPKSSRVGEYSYSNTSMRMFLLPRNVTPPKKVLTCSLKQINLFNSLLQNSDTNCFMEYLVDESVYNKIKNPLFFFCSKTQLCVFLINTNG